MFSQFTDKNTPRALIKHFCAQNSKPILFTLNLAPNKGKWVSYFEVEQCFFHFVLFQGHCPVETYESSLQLRTKKEGLLCAAECSVLVFMWNSAVVGCNEAFKSARSSEVQFTIASGVQVQTPRGTSKQGQFRKSHTGLHSLFKEEEKQLKLPAKLSQDRRSLVSRTSSDCPPTYTANPELWRAGSTARRYPGLDLSTEWQADYNLRANLKNVYKLVNRSADLTTPTSASSGKVKDVLFYLT